MRYTLFVFLLAIIWACDGRNQVEKDANLPAGYTQETALRAVRDAVYRRNVVGNGKSFEWNGEEIYAHLGQEPQNCAGMAVAYAWALGQVGIETHIAQLATARYLAGRDKYATHVTVEARINGKWRISDPTFNAEFTCGNGPVSVPEARKCGDRLHATDLGPQIPGRTLSAHWRPYAAYFAAWRLASVDGMKVYAAFPSLGWIGRARALYR